MSSPVSTSFFQCVIRWCAFIVKRNVSGTDSSQRSIVFSAGVRRNDMLISTALKIFAYSASRSSRFVPAG
jgi:hypothetical protein